MKAITIWQPWAFLVSVGLKTIETRTHDRFAGLVGQRIAIHAAKRRDTGYERNAAAIARPFIAGRIDDDAAKPFCAAIANGLPPKTFGAIIGTALVTGARPLGDADSPYALCPAAGLFGLFLSDSKYLKTPIPETGKQGIWTLDDSLTCRIEQAGKG